MQQAADPRSIYIQRINAVFDHIREHLTDDLSLEVLARVANFSPFHFHRIFTSMTGETLNDCVTRLRLERAVALMRAQPSLTITRAAMDTGFQRIETFSRAFRKQYGMSARSWDRQTPLKDRKNDQVFAEFPFYSKDALETLDEQGSFKVELRTMPEQKLAFIRVIDSYKPNKVFEAYERLMAWVRGQGLDPLKSTLYGMSQDDPEVTPLDLYRYDICMSVPDIWRNRQMTGEVCIKAFPACTVACVRVAGDVFLEDRVLQFMYRYWLPNSRYVPDNLPGMEIFRRHPAETGWEHFDIDAAIPVVRVG